MSILATQYGRYTLKRLPDDPSGSLRAWDAADEYLLSDEYHWPDYLEPGSLTKKRLLILNDTFGALGISMHQSLPISASDSYLSQQAARRNHRLNQCDTALTLVDSITPLPATTAIVIGKLPKNTRYFDYQLQLLNHYLPKGTPVVFGAMLKYISATFFKLLERHLDRFETTLARKKARLLMGFTQGNAALPSLTEPLTLDEFRLKLHSTPNVFAFGKLDQGTRFFLQHFPDLSQADHVTDLGCGNGALGIYALKNYSKPRVCFIDESYQAIHAARCGVETTINHAKGNRALFKIDDGLTKTATGSTDVILCNPPFHQHQALAGQIATQMFADSARVLRPEGTLYAIGNRHLGYHRQLKRYFNDVTVIASNPKFVMFEARRPA